VRHIFSLGHRATIARSSQAWWPTPAYLLSKSLPTMVILTISIAVVGALAGFGTAYIRNAATNATGAVFYGVLCIVALVVERLLRRRIGTSGERPASKEALS